MRTPGPAGKKYGIIDGQHGFMAIVDLWMDRALGPGAALSSLMRQGQSNPCFPSIVVENASNLNVAQLGMRCNEMYKHGNNRKAFYWMTKFVLFHNWSTFAGCRLSNSFEYGERFGAQDPDALLCVEQMKRMKLDATAMSRKTSIDTFRAAARLWYFDLFGAIIAEMDDLFSKMELLGYEPWYTCKEVLQNYYKFFKHVYCWTKAEAQARLMKLLQLYLLCHNRFHEQNLDGDKLRLTAAKMYIVFQEKLFKTIFVVETSTGEVPAAILKTYMYKAPPADKPMHDVYVPQIMCD
ncbi:hypothetical protein DYB37_011319, partial [Aphanomyces astaci]